MKLLNPIQYFQERTLLVFNLVVFSIGTVIAMKLNIRFDGVFDLHFSSKSVPLKSLIDNLVNIIILALMLMIVGRIINPKTRLIDCLNTAFISRIPFYFLALTNFGGKMSDFTTNLLASIGRGELEFTSNQYILLGILSVVGLFAIVLKGILLFNGYKIASNPKQTKHYVYFVIGLFITEILSSIILKNL